MAIISAHHLALLFGLLGNIVSFMVFLAPVPTFYRIYKKKSTEGFHSIPYSVALFSATLTLYYGLLKPNGLMLITINTLGCAIEGTYLTMYMIFAAKGAKMFTAKLLFIFNTVVYGSIVFLTTLLAKGHKRTTVVGWICAAFSVCVYAAPLSIISKVIKTKSVEFMPFSLSFFLTLCATMWFFYGLAVKDFFIAGPNVLGFLFGISQMILYVVYKNAKPNLLPEHKLQELTGDKFGKTEIPVDQPELTAANGKPSEAPESNV